MPRIIVDGYASLLALHRALYAAKFSVDPVVPEIPGSPLVATIAEQIIDALKQHEIDRGEPNGALAWERWQQMDPARPEWNIVLKLAEDFEKWGDLDEEDKKRRSITLFSPYKLSDEMLRHFIEEVTRRKTRQKS